MLKTLRITSLIALIAAVCGVIAIAVFGLRDDSDIMGFLDKPGVVDEAKDKIKPDDEKNDKESPLVTQLKAFALRIDPPPPPKPKVEKPKPVDKPKPELAREKPKPKPVAPPRPKTQVNAKFTLLATVQCAAEPTRSMALLKQTGGKQEWFRQGERVGHLDIDEVKDGSVIFSQGGRNSQELFVPVKPKVKSILKNENAQSAPLKAGPGSINVKLGDEPEVAAVPGVEPIADSSVETRSESAASTTGSGRVRLQRSRSETSTAASRQPADRVRARVTPRIRSPKEQKASIEGNISSIQEIMSRDTTSDPEQKQQENEAWIKLLKALEGEKQNLEKAQSQLEQADKKAQPEKTEADKKKQDDSPGDPNSSPPKK